MICVTVTSPLPEFACVGLLVSGKRRPDLKIQSLRQPLRLLLQRVSGKVAAVDVHVVQVPAHLVTLNAADQIHAYHEGPDQHGHKQYRHQTELQDLLAALLSSSSRYRVPRRRTLSSHNVHSCTELTPAG